LQGKIQMVFFCIFEVAVGIFWPSMMKMRATYVPDELRATIINLFRIPLNLFVCLVLANVSPVVAQPVGGTGRRARGWQQKAEGVVLQGVSLAWGVLLWAGLCCDGWF
jgi:hypothetical protein